MSRPPCPRCAALHGEGSALAPHAALVLQDALPVDVADPAGGTVRLYACLLCGSRLQRFCTAGGLDGWLVQAVRSQQATETDALLCAADSC